MKNLITKIGTNMSKAGGRTMLKINKYSPEILLATGIVSLVGAGVMASRATLKVEEILDDHQEMMGMIESVLDEQKERGSNDYTDEDYKKDKAIQFGKTSVAMVKLYAPAVTMGGLGIFCILSGHNIMKKRNVALMAAYKLMEGSFAEYRDRVIEDLGADKDHEYRYGLKSEKIKEQVEEDGKKKTVTKDISVSGKDVSGYARFFDSSCKEWTKNAEYNLCYLRSQQSYFNDMLKARGHVFLNEVYDALGIDRSNAGCVVGWSLSKNGDNYIDFGIYETHGRNTAFVNGYEPTILLDFNVDGVIYDLIDGEPGRMGK